MILRRLIRELRVIPRECQSTKHHQNIAHRQGSRKSQECDCVRGRWEMRISPPLRRCGRLLPTLSPITTRRLSPLQAQHIENNRRPRNIGGADRWYPMAQPSDRCQQDISCLYVCMPRKVRVAASPFAVPCHVWRKLRPFSFLSCATGVVKA